MIRMTLALAVALYAGLVIWGDPVTEATAGTTPAATDAAVAVAIAGAADFDRPVILSDDAGAPQVTRAAVTRTVVPEAAAIAEATVTEGRAPGEPTLVSLVPREAAPAAEAPAADGPRLRVSGDRVNMRAGPSTANPVVASLVAGTLAEPVGEPEGGWIEIRVVETGTTGFMAARFLDPA